MNLDEIAAAGTELATWHAKHAPRFSNLNLKLDMVNWTYDGDLHVPANKPRPGIVMGINPGDGNGAGKDGKPLCEKGKLSHSEKVWRTKSVKLANLQSSEIVFTELASISTKKVVDLRIADPSISEILQASVRVNRAIIAFHRPKVIYQSGFLTGVVEEVPALYGLRLSSKQQPNPEGRVLVHYEYELADGICVPWISFKHFSAHGYSNHDRKAIQDYVEPLISESR